LHAVVRQSASLVQAIARPARVFEHHVLPADAHVSVAAQSASSMQAWTRATPAAAQRPATAAFVSR